MIGRVFRSTPRRPSAADIEHQRRMDEATLQADELWDTSMNHLDEAQMCMAKVEQFLEAAEANPDEDSNLSAQAFAWGQAGQLHVDLHYALKKRSEAVRPMLIPWL